MENSGQPRLERLGSGLGRPVGPLDQQVLQALGRCLGRPMGSLGQQALQALGPRTPWNMPVIGCVPWGSHPLGPWTDRPFRPLGLGSYPLVSAPVPWTQGPAFPGPCMVHLPALESHGALGSWRFEVALITAAHIEHRARVPWSQGLGPLAPAPVGRRALDGPPRAPVPWSQRVLVVAGGLQRPPGPPVIAFYRRCRVTMGGNPLPSHQQRLPNCDLEEPWGGGLGTCIGTKWSAESSEGKVLDLGYFLKGIEK